MVKETPAKTTDKVAKILIVDDHPIVRYGVSRIINQEPDLTICGEAESPKQTMEVLKKTKPDAMILDISLESVLDGLRLAKVLRAKYPQLPILILSMHDESVYAQKALTAGANGYIMKEESSTKLVEAIKVVLKGDVYVSDSVNKLMLHSFSKPVEGFAEEVADRLSERECQVFAMIGAGHTTRDIADKLTVSVKTVETHRSRIKFKLSICSTPELVLAAASWAKTQNIAPAF